MMVLAWFSLTPTPPQIENDLFGWDKFQHAAAYGVLTLLAGWAFGTFSLDLKRRWRLAVVTTVLFGGFMEIAQGLFTTARTAEWGDLLADLIAAACAYGLVMVLNKDTEVKT